MLCAGAAGHAVGIRLERSGRAGGIQADYAGRTKRKSLSGLWNIVVWTWNCLQCKRLQCTQREIEGCGR